MIHTPGYTEISNFVAIVHRTLLAKPNNWTQKFKKGKCVASSKLGQLWFDLDNYTSPSPYNIGKLYAVYTIHIPFPINCNPNT